MKLLQAVLLVTLLAVQTTLAVNLLVYNTNDSGAGSLRQAIADNATMGGGNTIIFSNVVTGTITLTTGELFISNNVAILGPGANVLAVNGNAASRVFYVTNAVVTISGLAITNGSTGNGAGILNDHSTLTVNTCIIRGNSASSGGGIDNDGAVYGSATLTVINSTFSGNSAGTGGGIANAYATLEIGDTILQAGANGANIANYTNVFGMVTSDGYNLSSDNGGGFLNALGDQINTDPMLGPLQDNGGPTPTMMPLAGSPAIDKGKNLSGLATDQRGRCRTYDDPSIPNALGGDGTDIGSVEVSPAHTGIVNTTSDNSGSSLRYCLCDAQPGDTITFAPAVTGTVTLTSGELLIGKDVTILGPTASGLTVSGNNAARVFHVTAGTVSITSLTIANGFDSLQGGGVLNESAGTLVLSNCAVVSNVSSNGGGLFNNGTATAVNCTFFGNTASVDGGAMYNNASITAAALLSLFNSTVASNKSGTVGGGLFNASAFGSVARVRSTIIANNAGFLGPDVGGADISEGYNLVLNPNGPSGNVGFTNATDITVVDPLLGPLTDNGGPTPTMALRAGSPAIDQGNSFGLTTDQRGAPRPFKFASLTNAPGGDGSDIGAFELGSPRLNIQRAGATNVVLSWPGYYGDFKPQSTVTLSNSMNSWTAAPGTLVIVSNQYTLSNSIGAGNLFYRLINR